MASTRNINTRSDYLMEQKIYKNSSEYLLNPQRLFAHRNSYPTFGVNVGHMPLENLSSNGVDVESALMGINSTNLVNPQGPVYNQQKHLPNVTFFERKKSFLPEPLVIERQHRPFPIPK